MDILQASIDWAKAEVLSSLFFVLAGIVFLAGSAGLWQVGKTEMARAYVVPLLVAGALLLVIGLGLLYANKARLADFPAAHARDAAAFVEAEVDRAEQTLPGYRTVVFTVIPLIIVAAALMLLFVNAPTWRAIGITTIAMLVVILLVDSNSNARIEAYYEVLVGARDGLAPHQETGE